MKHAGGRPTKYDPAMIKVIEEYLEFAHPLNMEIPTVEGLCLKLGIFKDTAYRWAKEYPEFSDALQLVKHKQKEALIKIGIFGGKEVNATIVALLLKVNHNMIETTKSDITSGGKPLTSILGNGIPTGNSNGEAPEAN